MASISKSRFAVLRIEDDEDEVSSAKPSAGNKNQSNFSAAKKKDKKKKKEDEDLRNMAFGRNPTKPQKNSVGSSEHRTKPKEGGENWDEWKQRDTEVVQDMFEKDMQQAIFESKLEYEHQQQQKKKEPQKSKKTDDRESTNATANDSKSGKQKKKKTGKPQTMSLEEFKKMPAEVPSNNLDEEETASLPPPPPPVHTRLPLVDQDPHYFENVKNDAEKVVQKERIKEEYKKQYAQESLMSSKYRELLEKKDGEIAELQKSLKAQEEELKQVRKRNKQLCVILAQGEMKDKAQVLMQVEELTLVKDELTEQVARLTADLEKERSKVHALKLENDKLRGKHGNK